ncbi:MAG: RNA recognition motif domain-containing protein [Burkholderiaceae bacterium]|jgi:RNA recognition motif-containing protein
MTSSTGFEDFSRMGTKIYVGNLPWRATDAQLSELFGQHGDVTDAKIVTDRETGRSRGFGFVTMGNNEAAQAAIRALNGFSLEGRSLVVNEAREQSGGGGGGGGPRRGGFGGGGGGGGGGYGRGGGGGGGGGGYGRGGGGGGYGGGGGGGGGGYGGGGDRRARQFGG